MGLDQKSCVPCRGDTPPLKGKSVQDFLNQLGGSWQVINEHHLKKQFKFKNFADALVFTNKVGALSESQGHHPEITVTWGKVRIALWTHAIDGLSESDFILAAKIDKLS